MGIIDFINKFKKEKENKTYAKMLNGFTPVFSQFGKDIYASDVVQQAISCIVNEIKKTTPVHIRMKNSDPIPVNDEIATLLKQPNERMTTSEFIEKIAWNLFLNYNSFIIPIYKIEYKNGQPVKKYTELYPIQPTNVTMLQDNKGELYIKFKFITGYETTVKYNDVIHIKYRFSINEFMGGDETGQPDHKALLKTLDLNNTLLQGVAKALKSSFSINGVIKYNTMMDDGKMEKAIKNLEQRLKNNESGFLPLDIKGEFIPFQNKIQLVDDRTLKFIDEKILRNFGVSLPILTGDYTKEQYESFYQKTLEPLIISISQAFTKTLFTAREKSFGNEIKFYPHELIFLSTGQKIDLFNLLVDSASCYKNELRVGFGMQPLEELVGQLAMSSNKTNAENNKTDNKNNKEDKKQEKNDDDNENDDDQMDESKEEM